jgi:hypothetical protein
MQIGAIRRGNGLLRPCEFMKRSATFQRTRPFVCRVVASVGSNTPRGETIRHIYAIT